MMSIVNKLCIKGILRYTLDQNSKKVYTVLVTVKFSAVALTLIK